MMMVHSAVKEKVNVVVFSLCLTTRFKNKRRFLFEMGSMVSSPRLEHCALKVIVDDVLCSIILSNVFTLPSYPEIHAKMSQLKKSVHCFDVLDLLAIEGFCETNNRVRK
jgi:hypothetical protein